MGPKTLLFGYLDPLGNSFESKGADADASAASSGDGGGRLQISLKVSCQGFRV